MRMTQRCLIYLGSVLLLGCLGLCGCGASGSAQSAASSSTASAQSQLLAYARCLRAHGIQVPDPNPANPDQLNIPKSVQDNTSALTAAEAACRRYGGKQISGLNSGQAGNSREVKLAQCLRRHGIPVADPQPGQGLTLPPGTTTQSAAGAIEACTRSGTGSGG
jgi:hypothetical protein